MFCHNFKENELTIEKNNNLNAFADSAIKENSHKYQHPLTHLFNRARRKRLYQTLRH